MIGNVFEWCEDAYTYYEAATWKKETRGVRGGSYSQDADELGSAHQQRLDPRDKDFEVGFRTVATAFNSAK